MYLILKEPCLQIRQEESKYRNGAAISRHRKNCLMTGSPLRLPHPPGLASGSGGEVAVTDALMVVLMVGFFVLAGLFVAWLDRV